MDIPKEGLVFHGIPENYDYEKGIWYDANSSKNHFKLADSLKPILVRNGKVYGFGANVLKEDIDSSYKFPFIRTFPKAFFELNKNIFGDGNTDRTFIVVVKPYNLDLEKDEKNNLIHEANDSSKVNEFFTCLRINNSFFVVQQRSEFEDYLTRDTRYGIQLSQNIILENKKVSLYGRVYHDSIYSYINGIISGFHSIKTKGHYRTNRINIMGGKYYFAKKNTDYSFSGVVYKVLLYNRSLNVEELKKINKILNL